MSVFYAGGVYKCVAHFKTPRGTIGSFRIKLMRNHWLAFALQTFSNISLCDLTVMYSAVNV